MHDWHDKHYAFFQNTACEYFPCHETKFPERFNCLFCYCPLYALGKDCGGNFRYTAKRYQGLLRLHDSARKGKLWARDGAVSGPLRANLRAGPEKRIKTCPPQTLALR